MNDPRIRKTVIPFLIVSVILFVANAILIMTDLFEKVVIKDWFWNYVFLVPVSLVGLAFIAGKYYQSQKITSIGKNYILYTVVKMVLAVVFLLPWLLHKDDSSKPMVIQFFAIFFPFLLVETILLVRLLNTPLDEKIKNEENQGQ